jgi:SAM-dependent methyltransferase
MYAPAPYEQVYVLSALFCFEKPYMTGYFGDDYNVEEVVDLCMMWLPVHAWGHATIKGNFSSVEKISSFAVMREKLYELVKSEKDKTICVDAKTHYDVLIDENNDPVHDPKPLKEYMNKWDGEPFFESLQLTSDKSVLEIGVGTGRLAVQICDKCKTFVGIDISPKTVERVKENLKTIQNALLICGDFLTHEFTESFDIIYSSLTFMHIKDKQDAVQKAASLLNGNGRFILSINKEQQAMLDFGNRQIELYPNTPEEIVTFLTGAGFTVESQIETEFAVIFAAHKGAKK